MRLPKKLPDDLKRNCFSMQNVKPITAEIIRRKCNKHDASYEGNSSLFNHFAREVEREFRSYHTTVIKCSNGEQAVGMLNVEDQAEPPIVLSGSNEPLKIWISADSSIDSLLSEICLGGIGIISADQEEGRPPSKFENSLRNAVFRAIAQSFIQAAIDLRAITFTLPKLGWENDTFIEKKPEKCVALKLLINAFTLSTTITVHFRQEEFERYFSIATKNPQGSAATLRGVLDGAPFELNAYLAATKMPLENILGMELGSVLPLGIRVSTPVEVRCQGLVVSLASLALRETIVELVLLPHAGLPNRF